MQIESPLNLTFFAKPKLNAFLQQESICDLPFNRLITRSLITVLNMDSRLAEDIKIKQDILTHGLACNKHVQYQQLCANLLKDFSQLECCFEFNHQNQKSVSKKLCINTILGIQSKLLKLCVDIGTTGVMYVTNPFSLKSISILPLALYLLQSFEASTIRKSNNNCPVRIRKHLQEVPKRTVIRIGEKACQLDRNIYDWCEKEYLMNVNNLQFIDIYFEDEINVNYSDHPARMHLNVYKQFGLSMPLDFNFVYLFRSMILEQIKYFCPDFIILSQFGPLDRKLVENDTLALVLNDLIDVSHGRVLYYREMGLKQNMTCPLKNLKNREQIQLFDQNVNIDLNTIKQLMHQQLSITLGTLTKNMNVNYVLQRYHNFQFDLVFTSHYESYIEDKYKVCCQPAKFQYFKRIQLSKSIHNRITIFRKLKQTHHNRFTKFYNLASQKIQILSTLDNTYSYTEQDQFYVKYFPQSLYFILFDITSLKVMTKKHTDHYFQLVYALDFASMKCQQEMELAVTDSCLVASDRYLYRAFGKTQTNKYSNKIFRLRFPRQVNQTFLYQLLGDSAKVINNFKEVEVKLQAKSNANGFCKQNNIYIMGGYVDSHSEDHTSKNVVVIKQHQSKSEIYSYSKVSKAKYDAMIIDKRKHKIHFIPQLYCVPLSNAQVVKVLCSNAIHFESANSNRLFLNEFNTSKGTDCTFENQFQYKFPEDKLYVQMTGGCTLLVNKQVLNNMVLYLLTQSTRHFNRYSNTKVCVMVNEPEQACYVLEQAGQFEFKFTYQCEEAWTYLIQFK